MFCFIKHINAETPMIETAIDAGLRGFKRSIMLAKLETKTILMKPSENMLVFVLFSMSFAAIVFYRGMCHSYRCPSLTTYIQSEFDSLKTESPIMVKFSKLEGVLFEFERGFILTVSFILESFMLTSTVGLLITLKNPLVFIDTIRPESDFLTMVSLFPSLFPVK